MNDMLNTKSASEKYIADYRILTELASSTSSRIFLAEHKSSHPSPVVVKLFYSTSINTAQDTARFLTEIGTLRQLQHPSIVPILDAGIDKGTPYIVIPYLMYGSLHELMQQNRTRPVPIEDAVHILVQIGQALHYAHQRSIFHGNLKPRNVLFTQDGHVQLADFLCMTVHKTVNGSSLINPDATFYMAPEQLTGAPDAASDQYALGCLAYELFTTHKPFKPSFSTEQQREDPLTPAELHLTLPEHIEQAVLKAIAREPGERYPDILTFINALPPYDVETTKLATPSSSTSLHEEQETNKLAATSAPSSVAEPDTAVVPHSPVQNRPRRRRLWLLIACIAIVIVASGLLSSSLLFAHSARKMVPLMTAKENTPTTLMQTGTTDGTVTHSPAITTGTASATTSTPVLTNPAATNSSPARSIAQLTPAPHTSPQATVTRATVSTPTHVIVTRTTVTATPQPMMTMNPLQISPTSFTPANCVVDNSNYRCTAVLQLNDQFQGQLIWQVSTTGINAKLNSISGTISPGQDEQIIIYIQNACPQSGSITFAGSGTSATATWTC